MDERKILHRISHRDQKALEAAVSKYSAYVVTVIHNRSRGLLSPEDEEEIASDVFFSLWKNACSITPGHLKSWLGTVSKNKTVDRMRQFKITVPLEDNTLVLEDVQWERLHKEERAALVRQALSKLSPLDREIFCRYYDLCQTANAIAAELNMPPSTVRTRLSRGRKVLRNTLCQGGFSDEDTN